MKKLLFVLSFLLLFPCLVFAHYDDFETTYESYYKVIDTCDTATGWTTIAGAAAIPVADTSDIKDGTGTILWNKDNSATLNTSVAKQAAYNCDLGALTNAGYLQFWY